MSNPIENNSISLLTLANSPPTLKSADNPGCILVVVGVPVAGQHSLEFKIRRLGSDQVVFN